MPYKALTYIALGEERKAPGDKITKAELDAANQTEEDIAALIKGGSLSEDMDAEIHKAHAPVEITVPENTTHIMVTDEGKGETNAN